MKKEILIGAAAFFLMSLTALTGVYAVENKANTVTITSVKTDITGDRKNEIITLKGVPFQKQGEYLKTIYIEISSTDGKTYRFPLESGEKASIQIADLNQDGVKDLFATVVTGKNTGDKINYLFTLKDFKPTALPVPKPLELKSRFLEGYKATLSINQTNKTYLFDLQNRSHYYDQIGIYQKGTLNEPAELTVNSYSILTPELVDGGKLGLKGVQRITGIPNGDTIANVESYWINVNGDWKLVRTDVLNGGAKK